MKLIAKYALAICGTAVTLLLAAMLLRMCAHPTAYAVRPSETHKIMEKSPQNPTTTPAMEIVFEETVTEIEYTSVKSGDKIVATASAYCSCAECCGVCTGITASGQEARPGICAANWLPLGSVIEFNGKRYEVLDHGGSHFDIIGRIDIYFDSHDEALNWGKRDGFITIISVATK